MSGGSILSSSGQVVGIHTHPTENTDRPTRKGTGVRSELIIKAFQLEPSSTSPNLPKPAPSGFGKPAQPGQINSVKPAGTNKQPDTKQPDIPSNEQPANKQPDTKQPDILSNEQPETDGRKLPPVPALW
jgi:hypothetical protein